VIVSHFGAKWGKYVVSKKKKKGRFEILSNLYFKTVNNRIALYIFVLLSTFQKHPNIF
jgi:hypothetical protein